MAKDSGDRHDFWASFLVMKENLEEIEDFICVAHSLGINNIRFMHLNPNWRSFWGVRMSPDFTFKYLEQSNKSVINTFRQRFSQYQEMAAKLGVNIRYGNMPSRVVAAYNLKRLVNEATVFIRDYAAALATSVKKKVWNLPSGVQSRKSSSFSPPIVLP